MHPIKIAQSMLKDCYNCGSRGQLKAYDIPPLKVPISVNALAQPIFLNIVIILCGDCYGTGRVINNDIYWAWLQNETEVYKVEYVKEILDYFFTTEIGEFKHEV